MTGDDLRAELAAMPPEFHLIAACCRPRDCYSIGAVADAAAAGFDAATLLALALVHRVEGFVEGGLREAGVTLDTKHERLLAERAHVSRAQMLRNAAEEVRLSKLFAEAGIDAVFVKGATLAMLAHGGLGLKTSSDVDVLVPDPQISVARGLLESAGYSPQLPDGWDMALFDRFLAATKETNWYSTQRSVNLDLHRALVDAPALLPEVTRSPVTQCVPVARGVMVNTLTTPVLLAYLGVHGMMHRWSRLKWLCDFAGLAARNGGLDAIPSQGASRSVEAAMWLSAHIFAMPLDPRRVAEIEARHTCGRLIAMTLETLGESETTATGKVLGDFPLRCLQAAGIVPLIAVLSAQLSTVNTPLRASLPAWLLPLHAMAWYPWRLTTRIWRHLQSGKTPTTP